MSRPALRFPDLSRHVLRFVACALLFGSAQAGPVPAEADAPAPPAAAVKSSTDSPVGAAVPRVVAGVYRGTLGHDTIEMTLTQDKDAEDSVHGWYVVLGSPHPERVQLAGEWEDDTLSLEESHNGIDVSGNWSAIFNADGFAGQWSDINGEHATDIALLRVKPSTTKKKS